MPRLSTSPIASAPAMPPDEAPGDPLSFQLLNEVGIIDQLARHRGEQLLGDDLNLPQFVVLNHLTRLGGDQSLAQMAAAIQVTKGAMSNTVGRLQAKGLLDVQPDPLDGRGKRVSLTDAGRAARRQALASLGQGLAEVAALVPAEEMRAALATLRTLRVWFDTHR